MKIRENTLYQADKSSENFQTKIYYHISETRRNVRTMKKSFNHEKHRNDTELSSELWKIKASRKESVLVRKVLGQYQPCNVTA